MSEFINIPSFLTENDSNTIDTNSIMSTSCTGCLSFCEVYNECCGYEDCQATSESGCTSSCENSCQTTCEKGCQVGCEVVAQNITHPHISISNITGTSLIAKVVDLDSNFAYNRTFYWSANGVSKGVNYTSPFANSSPYITISDLQPNTTYTIKASIYSGETYLTVLTENATTLAKIKPTQWDWSSNKVAGNSFNITSSEWIDFCNKINEIRDYNDLPLFAFTTSTTYISKGKPFSAWIFKQACEAINQINGQVASQLLNVKSGDSIYAWYFSNLRTALNNAIL